MRPVRILLGLVLLVAALTPLVAHFAWIAPALVRIGARPLAALDLVGCVFWLAICWRAWPPERKVVRQ